jgi:hypothetical protein
LWQRFGTHVADQHEHDPKDCGELPGRLLLSALSAAALAQASDEPSDHERRKAMITPMLTST